MSGFIECVDRDQVTLFPERLEDWIGEDHLVAAEHNWTICSGAMRLKHVLGQIEPDDANFSH